MKSQKAGVIPYYIDKEENVKMLFMVPSDPKYGESHYQIAKGMLDNEDSDIFQSALRGGKEELGLKGSNVRKFYFGCVSKIKEYELHVYVADIINPNDFNETDYEVKETKWLSIEEDFLMIREVQQLTVEYIYNLIREMELL